jgi:hypothetical protein
MVKDRVTNWQAENETGVEDYITAMANETSTV